MYIEVNDDILAGNIAIVEDDYKTYIEFYYENNTIKISVSNDVLVKLFKDLQNAYYKEAGDGNNTGR